MSLLDQLLNGRSNNQSGDALAALNFDRGEFDIPNPPNVNELPVKQASDDTSDSEPDTVEVKNGIASSGKAMAWYEVVFDVPFSDGTKPTVTAVAESRGSSESQGQYSPPSHDSPGITALELLDISIPDPSLSERSLTDRSLNAVDLADVSISNRALNDRALNEVGLQQRELSQVQLQTDVSLPGVDLPTVSLPQASIPEISLGQFEVQQQTVPTAIESDVSISEVTEGDIGSGIVNGLTSLADNRQSVQQALADESQYTQFSEESFGEGLGIEDLRFTDLQDIDAIPSFEENLKRRNRETGEAIANEMSNRVDGAFWMLDFQNNYTILDQTLTIGFDLQDDVENELKAIIDRFSAELYGAPSSDSSYTPSGGEGIYESIWGAIGAELDDIKNKFLLTGDDIRALRDQIDSAFNDFSERLTGSDQVTGALETFVQDLVNDLTSTFSNFDTGINDLASLTDSELRNMASNIDTNFGNTRDTINSRMGEIETVVNDKLALISQMKTDIENAINSLTDNVNSALADLGANVESEVSTLKQNIQTSINDQSEQTQTQINELSNTTQTQLTELRDSIENQIIQNNDAIRDSINVLNGNVRDELISMNTNIENVINNVVADADTELKNFKTNVEDNMNTTIDEIRNNNNIVETTLQDMNSNIDSTISGMNSDIENTITSMNQEVDEQMKGLSNDTQSELVDMRDDIEGQINALSDDIEAALNEYNQNITNAYNDITALAEQSLNESTNQVYEAIGAPAGQAISPVQIRNVDETGFEFLGYRGGLTIHWNAIGEAGEVRSGGGGGVGRLPSPPESELPGIIFR